MGLARGLKSNEADTSTKPMRREHAPLILPTIHPVLRRFSFTILRKQQQFEMRGIPIWIQEFYGV